MDLKTIQLKILDDLPLDLVNASVDFFNDNYPTRNKFKMESKFFISKIQSSDNSKVGYFTVALFGDKVVGTCTAVVKELYCQNGVIRAVEIGDTYTARDFRRGCHFSEFYAGTNSSNDYLNKSIFGRLATETLDRARLDGVQFVYGTPNLQAKLSWLGRLDFKLVDGGYIKRITSPSIAHPQIKSTSLKFHSAKIYLKATFRINNFMTRRYSLKLIPKLDFEYSVDKSKIKIPIDTLKILDSNNWIKRRFLENIDKDYRIVKVSSKSSNLPVGYLFFLEQEMDDGFKLLILGKSIFNSKRLNKIRISLAKRAAENFFVYDSLSMWVDERVDHLRFKTLFGFFSRAVKVDIVGKSLNPESKFLENMSFFNFQYADSDLG